jgi:thiol-disulfide isomerase/thioredoxin
VPAPEEEAVKQIIIARLAKWKLKHAGVQRRQGVWDTSHNTVTASADVPKFSPYDVAEGAEEDWDGSNMIDQYEGSVEEFTQLLRGAADEDKAVVVDYHADWCPGARRIKPLIVSLCPKYRKLIFVFTKDSDKWKAGGMSEWSKLTWFPCFRLYVQGVEVSSLVHGKSGTGYPDDEEILEWFDKAAKGELERPVNAEPAEADV